MSGCRSCSGRLFHSVGPAVAKERSPNWFRDLSTTHNYVRLSANRKVERPVLLIKTVDYEVTFSFLKSFILLEATRTVCWDWRSKCAFEQLLVLKKENRLLQGLTRSRACNRPPWRLFCGNDYGTQCPNIHCNWSQVFPCSSVHCPPVLCLLHVVNTETN